MLYAATGHRGRVYRIDPSGKSTLLWTAEQPEIFAIAVDANGVVYAGTSPDGKVYRIENGKATEYFAPECALYLVAGRRHATARSTWAPATRARSSAWPAAGSGELYYETGQSHVTGLAVDSQGRLLAGTEPNGILYRISAKDKAFVLYDANLPEIRAIVPMPDGTVYAAALGGSTAKRAQAAAQAAQGMTGAGSVPVTTTTITVEAQRADRAPKSSRQIPSSRASLLRPRRSPTPAGQYPVHARHRYHRRRQIGRLPDQSR